MRRIVLGLTVAVGLGLVGSTGRAQAQVGFAPGFSDPFFLYYGWYLPRQAALAAQPTIPNQINDVASARQSYAVADRAGLYDPIRSPFAPPSDEDMLAPYDPRRLRGRGEPLPRLPGHFVNPRASSTTNHLNFKGPNRYFPSARVGSFANKNTVGMRRFGPSFGAGAMGMPTAPGSAAVPSSVPSGR